MTTAHDFTLPSIGGGEIRLKDFAGEAVLLVNTASECGFTPQYRGLEELWLERKDKGLVVLGVPSNDFGAQEPGTEAEIMQFCTRNFAVTFPMTAKQKVIGGDAHPLYRWIAGALGEGAAPKWNFHKYLIGPDGGLAGAWPSKVAPTSPEIARAIDAALAKPGR
jgi:glutathione peroxidase